mmetsp:Transcript_3865/g.5824  ORF Transcript_3865/g.5824 Transcript_3865/m.5824 type:complete len:339 (-) Transcript_3865:127-1143(-)
MSGFRFPVSAQRKIQELTSTFHPNQRLLPSHIALFHLSCSKSNDLSMSSSQLPFNKDSDGEWSSVECTTTAGTFTMEFYKKWSPIGYERAFELFQRGWYDGSHLFRVIHGFLAQFGMSYTKNQELRHFADLTIPDDPQLEPRVPFDEGVISFAGSGPNSRTSHLFIAYGPIPSLGTQLWETPVGLVTKGIEVVQGLYGEYGDKPVQWKISEKGEEYINAEFPHLDKFLECRTKSFDEIMVEQKEFEELEREVDLGVKHESVDEQPVGNIETKSHVRGHVAVDNAKEAFVYKAREITEGETVQKITHHLGFPICAAFVVFAALMCIMRGSKKKVDGKKN